MEKATASFHGTRLLNPSHDGLYQSQSLLGLDRCSLLLLLSTSLGGGIQSQVGQQKKEYEEFAFHCDVPDLLSGIHI